MGFTKEGGILRVSKYGKYEVETIYLVDLKTYKRKKLITRNGKDGEYLDVACNKKAAFLSEDHKVWIAHKGVVESYISEKEIQKEIEPILDILRKNGRIKEDPKAEWKIYGVDFASRDRLELYIMIEYKHEILRDYILSCSLTEHPGNWHVRRIH